MPTIARPWGFCCYEAGEQVIFGRMRETIWEETPAGEDLRGDGRMRTLEAMLTQRQAAPSLSQRQALPRDAVFLETLRDAALLVSLEPRSCLRCKIRPDQRGLAEAVIHDLYDNALPRLQFLPFAAGTEQPPAKGFRLLFLTDPPPGNSQCVNCVFVDFTAGQPLLQLNFPQLNFAQRTLRALLPPLGLGLLLSMWNAAAHSAELRLGARRAAEYTDLTAWLMLRRNFPANEYPVTGPEHAQLQKRVEEYEEAA